MIKYHRLLGIALLLVAAIFILLELGEFLISGYIWCFVIDGKVLMLSDYIAVVVLILANIGIALSSSIVILCSLHQEKYWPSKPAFLYAATALAITQLVFLLLNMSHIQMPWFENLLESKAITFSTGLLSAVLMLFVGRYISPWRFEND